MIWPTLRAIEISSLARKRRTLLAHCRGRTSGIHQFIGEGRLIGRQLDAGGFSASARLRQFSTGGELLRYSSAHRHPRNDAVQYGGRYAKHSIFALTAASLAVEVLRSSVG
jgi:hypothetical protein